MELKIGSLIVGVLAFLLALFKFKEMDSKLSFFWLAFVLITQGFSKYFGIQWWLIFVAAATVILGMIQGIRKRDKTYIILVGVMLVLIMDILWLKPK